MPSFLVPLFHIGSNTSRLAASGSLLNINKILRSLLRRVSFWLEFGLLLPYCIFARTPFRGIIHKGSIFHFPHPSNPSKCSLQPNNLCSYQSFNLADCDIRLYILHSLELSAHLPLPFRPRARSFRCEAVLDRNPRFYPPDRLSK